MTFNLFAVECQECSVISFFKLLSFTHFMYVFAIYIYTTEYFN